MIITLTDGVLFSTYFLLLFLAIFWLLVLLGSREEPKKKLSSFPSFTAIVPAYNEENSIGETLQSLLALDYPAEKVQLIVVNDGSTDRTRQKVEESIRSHPQREILLLNQVNMGKGKALNSGLEKAKGEFYACLDADSFVSPNALREMLPYFAEENVAAVCPLLKVKKPACVLQKVQWTEYIVNMLYKFLNAQLDCVHVTPGPFSVYRTSVIRKLGGYDEHTITEDLEIALRLQKHHYKIIQTFDAAVETLSPDTWRELFRQRVRWYRGSIENALTYKSMIFNRRYGDFGYVRMPTIFLSGILAVVLTGTLLKDLIVRGVQNFQSLAAINFDFLTLLKNYSFSINLLSLPLFKYFIGLTLFLISIGVMLYSYRLVREKIANHGKTWISLVAYLSVYALFISVVWLYIGFLLVTKRKNSWS